MRWSINWLVGLWLFSSKEYDRSYAFINVTFVWYVLGCDWTTEKESKTEGNFLMYFIFCRKVFSQLSYIYFFRMKTVLQNASLKAYDFEGKSYESSSNYIYNIIHTYKITMNYSNIYIKITYMSFFFFFK